MKQILIDGSNVSLAGSGGSKLTSLSMLSQMIHCLLAHGYTPYTIFDASFKHRINEESQGRKDFNHLTKKVSEYFQMSPAGEEADLFLLQLALELECPVISNDTFKQYGKISDNKLRYEGRDVPIFNFQIFAGVVIIPDLKIRRTVGATEREFSGIEAVFTNPPLMEKPISPVQEIAEPKQDQPKDAIPQTELTQEELQGITRVVTRFVKGGAQGGLTNLSRRLSDHRSKYLKRSGVPDNSGRTWFGFGKLSEFLRTRFPDFRVNEGKSDEKT